MMMDSAPLPQLPVFYVGSLLYGGTRVVFVLAGFAAGMNIFFQVCWQVVVVTVVLVSRYCLFVFDCCYYLSAIFLY